MSVEHRTAIIVGVTEEQFFELFPSFSPSFLDNDEEFVDDFYISADSWCNGQHFIGKYVSELDEGEWRSLDEILSANQRLAAIKKYREDMKKYGYDIPEYLIKFFIVSQVF